MYRWHTFHGCLYCLFMAMVMTDWRHVYRCQVLIYFFESFRVKLKRGRPAPSLSLLVCRSLGLATRRALKFPLNQPILGIP